MIKQILLLGLAIIAMACSDNSQKLPFNDAKYFRDMPYGKPHLLKEKRCNSKETFWKSSPQKDCFFVSEITFNQQGRVSQDKQRNLNVKEMDFTLNFQYDENNKLTSIVRYKNNEPFTKSVTLQYSKNGLVTQQEFFNQQGKRVTTFTAEYDNANNQTDLIVYYSGETTDKFQRKTEYQDNKKVSTKEYRNDELVMEKYFEYNKEGFVSVEKTIKPTKSTLTIKYKYDNKGNWTEKVFFDEQGKPVKITEREITYYE
ncbi:MAG: hypothetical protein KGV56_05630 [Gammaproteobacteria bacterium]|nr:hypothetical protein [Gammaproteobacteria bacterium]